MLGGIWRDPPRQCLHQGTALSWALGEQLVKELPGQCRFGRAWQQSWSGRAPEGKVCPLKATWHHHPATHPTASRLSHVLPGLADHPTMPDLGMETADGPAHPLQSPPKTIQAQGPLWDGAWGMPGDGAVTVSPQWDPPARTPGAPGW